MVTFENQKRSNFVLKDLSTITANKVIFLQEICGKIFTTPQIDNAGVVLVFDCQRMFRTNSGRIRDSI
jgi:hypothetical protein